MANFTFFFFFLHSVEKRGLSFTLSSEDEKKSIFLTISLVIFSNIESIDTRMSSSLDHRSWFRLYFTYAEYRIFHALVVINNMHNSLRIDRFTTNIKLTAQDRMNRIVEYLRANFMLLVNLPLPNLLCNVLFFITHSKKSACSEIGAHNLLLTTKVHYTETLVLNFCEVHA